jgi:ferric-dicitrate binding protein FerR (iron transport regulator)
MWFKNQKNRLKYLLLQYAGKQISDEELSELKTMVNASDDEELDESLREIWMNNEYPAYLPNEKQITQMICRIEEATRAKDNAAIVLLYKRLTGAFTRIAAIFVLALLSGICVHLYRDNQQLSAFRNSATTLNVGHGQEASYTLPDGTGIRLNSESTLSYNNTFGEKNRLVSLSGEAYFEVKKDGKRPFIVSTSKMNIEVTGTSFNVYAFDNDNLAEVTLMTGSVKVSSKKNPECEALLKSGEKAVYDVSTGEISVQEVDIRQEAAWLNGELVFKSETLRNALAKIERKYGIHICYEGKLSLLDDRFSGRIAKNYNISDVMKILTGQYPLKYKHKGDQIVLYDHKHN